MARHARDALEIVVGVEHTQAHAEGPFTPSRFTERRVDVHASRTPTEPVIAPSSWVVVPVPIFVIFALGLDLSVGEFLSRVVVVDDGHVP